MCDALAAEENVFGSSVAAAIGFREDVAAGAVPVELAASFCDAATVTVIEIVHAAARVQLAFGVPRVGVDTIARGVAREIITKARKVIVAVGGHGRRKVL